MELSQTVSSDRLGSTGKPHSLGVSEVFGFAAELFQQKRDSLLVGTR
jgi:hypothetical protein